MNELIPNKEIELTPEEAQTYNKKGWVLVWKDKEAHNKGEPKIRTYIVLGKN